MTNQRRDGGEHREQQRIRTEVAARRLVFAGECGEFIEDRPEPFGLRFSDAQHLHRIGIQVSCEVACGFAVREHVEVLPEQLLDQ